jgi:transcriptional regulator with XRE-family HTH domain
MNSVERVRAICKSQKIAISKLEKDLGFSNGYISQLRKGTFPAERLLAIAEYLKVSRDYLLSGEEKNSPGKPEPTERELKILEALRSKTPDEQRALLTLLGISED